MYMTRTDSALFKSIDDPASSKSSRRLVNIIVHSEQLSTRT